MNSKFKPWLLRCSDDFLSKHLKWVIWYYRFGMICFGIMSAFFWCFFWSIDSDNNARFCILFNALLTSYMLIYSYRKGETLHKDIPDIIADRTKYKEYLAQFNGKDS